MEALLNCGVVALILLRVTTSTFGLITVEFPEKSTAILPCSDRDSETDRVQWFHSTSNNEYRNGPPAVASKFGNNLQANPGFSVSSDFALIIISAVNGTHDGIYRCSAYVEYKQVSHSDVKLVLSDTAYGRALSTIVVPESSCAVLPCDHFVQGSENVHVQWFKSTRDDYYQNGPPAVASSKNGTIEIFVDGLTMTRTFSLILYSVTKGTDDGIYRCTVRTKPSLDKRDFDVRLNISDAIVKQKSIDSVSPTISATVNGSIPTTRISDHPDSEIGKVDEHACKCNDGKVSVEWFVSTLIILLVVPIMALFWMVYRYPVKRDIMDFLKTWKKNENEKEINTQLDSTETLVKRDTMNGQVPNGVA